MEQRLALLEGRVESLDEKLSAIHTALLGEVNGEPGTVHYMREAIAELKAQKGEHRDLVKRVDVLERDNWKTKGLIAGIGGAVGAGLGHWWNKLTGGP